MCWWTEEIERWKRETGSEGIFFVWSRPHEFYLSFDLETVLELLSVRRDTVGLYCTGWLVVGYAAWLGPAARSISIPSSSSARSARILYKL